MKVTLWKFLSLVILSLLAFGVQAQGGEDVIPGRIAYIGADYNVYVWTGLDTADIQLTDDATREDGLARRYQMPTWSSDGRLAYFGNEIMQNAYTTEVYVSSDGVADGEQIYVGSNEVLNYAAWSPQNCAVGEGCRELAMLLNGRTAGGLFVKVVSDAVPDFPSEIIGRGGPFYFSWSSNGENMIWQRNNTRLDIFNMNQRSITEQLPNQPGMFQAPHWSPVDDRVLIGELNEDRATTDLTVVMGESSEPLVRALDGVVYFSWSPNGNYVAYTMRNEALVVVDSRTGEVVSETIVESIGPFFWSPDSSKIAFVTLATPEGTFTTDVGVLARPAPQAQVPDLAWSVMEVDDGEVRRYSAFIPTREMVYLFTYFDQFSKSHSLWSPDSRYLVYSELSDEDQPVISIIDTSVQDTFPLAIAEGYLGIWSY